MRTHHYLVSIVSDHHQTIVQTQRVPSCIHDVFYQNFVILIESAVWGCILAYHDLAGLLGLGSLAWAGHYIHVSLPINKLYDL